MSLNIALFQCGIYSIFSQKCWIKPDGTRSTSDHRTENSCQPITLVPTSTVQLRGQSQTAYKDVKRIFNWTSEQIFMQKHKPAWFIRQYHIFINFNNKLDDNLKDCSHHLQPMLPILIYALIWNYRFHKKPVYSSFFKE